MGWEVIGYSSDPIPDDPARVAAGVQHLQNVATVIQQQVDRIAMADGQVDSLVWKSDAAQGFREVVKKLPKDLGTLKTRYERVSHVMSDFNNTLRGCKADVAQGYADAQRAHADILTYTNGVKAMHDHATQAQAAADKTNADNPDSPAVSPEPWSGPDYNALLASAERQLAAAKDRVDGAVKRFKDASRHAAGGVNDANHDDLKNDTSLWGSIKRGAHWLAEHVPLEAIAGILSKVSAVFGIIALIPIPIVQEIAAAIALGAAGLTLLADLVIQTNKSYEGTFTWGDFALTIGIDSVAFVASAGAFRAGNAARAATASSRVAVAEATAAREAAAGATAARETVDATVAARAARLRQLTGGPIRSFVNGLLGRTGRAETQLANAERSLSAASRAEQQALAVSAAKSSAATAAETTANAAEHASHVWEAADKSAAAAGVANVVAHEHVHTWNPVTAITRSTQQEISELQHWGRRDGLPEIPAQPIP